jgi:hypothetical protein
MPSIRACGAYRKQDASICSAAVRASSGVDTPEPDAAGFGLVKDIRRDDLDSRWAAIWLTAIAAPSASRARISFGVAMP